MRQFWRVIYPILIYFAITVAAVLISFTTDAVFNTLFAGLFAIPVLGYLFWKDQRMRGISLLTGGLSGKMMVFTVLLGMTASLAVNNLISISRLGDLFPGFSEVSVELYSPPLWLQIAAIGLVIPAAEELVFRGLGFARLRDETGFWRAAVVSSLIFGIYHGNVVQFVYALILGLMMCWIYEQTGSLLGPVFFHQAANLLSVVFTEIFGETEVLNSGMSFYMITVAAVLLMLLIIREIKKNIHKEGLT